MSLYCTTDSNETLKRSKVPRSLELEQPASELDLNQYSEEERMLVLGVIKRDLEVRNIEQSRLSKLHTQIISDDKAIVASTISNNNNNCIICKEGFRFLFKPKKICDLCRRPVCKLCCNFFAVVNNWLCSICVNQIFYKAMVYHWFYENAPNVFADYASNSLIKRLFKEKVPVINDVPEDQLHKIVTAHLGPSRNAIINGELITPELMKNAQATQLNQFREKYNSIKLSSLDALSSIRAKPNLSEAERKSQTDDFIKEFTQNTHNLISQMFQMLCITLEKYNVSLGINGEQTSTMVLKIAESEVQSIVGKQISIPNEYLLYSAEDDVETCLASVTGGPEEFLANALLEDLYKSFANMNGNKKQEEAKLKSQIPIRSSNSTEDLSKFKSQIPVKENDSTRDSAKIRTRVPKLNGEKTNDSSELSNSVTNENVNTSQKSTILVTKVNGDSSQKPPPSQRRTLKQQNRESIVKATNEESIAYQRSASIQDITENGKEKHQFRDRVDSITQCLPKARDLRHSTRDRVGQSVMIEALFNDPGRRKQSSTIK